MTLTAKQELFAQSIADGMTQADAYRTAYSAVNMKADSIHVKASQLMADGKIAVRVKTLREALAEKQLWTRADSVEVLRSIAECKESPEAARVSSVKELNSMHGFNEPSKVDLTHKGITSIALEAVDGAS
jgi:phage terminase small subunit